ncbi:hypothetical protein ACR42D_05255 [Desulfovibrio caledoniensis]
MNDWSDYNQWRQAYNSLIEFGKSTLTTSALLNGGAATAIITAASISSFEIKKLKYAIFSFSIGAACALLSLGLAYLSEYILLQKHRSKPYPRILDRGENIIRYLSWVVALLSILSFCVGILVAYRALN